MGAHSKLRSAGDYILKKSNHLVRMHSKSISQVGGRTGSAVQQF